MFGLLKRDIYYIQKACSKFCEIDKVVVFGSRAMGNYKKGSDVDIAIMGKNVTRYTLGKLDDYLNEVYPLPYFFDIIHYESLINENLKHHIDNHSKVIYYKEGGVYEFS
jgi:predicted nucleotidyltransferase